jgi:hypothetical protein
VRLNFITFTNTINKYSIKRPAPAMIFYNCSFLISASVNFLPLCTELRFNFYTQPSYGFVLKALIFLGVIKILFILAESPKTAADRKRIFFSYYLLLIFTVYFSLLFFYPTNPNFVLILGEDFINTIVNKSFSIQLTTVTKFHFWWFKIEHLYFRID